MEILLINPSWGHRVHGRRYNRRWPPLDLLNLGALLRLEGFDVILHDARAGAESSRPLADLVHGADFVILTTSPLDRWQCPNLDLKPLLPWAALVPPEKLILCGAHGTVFPEALMKMTGARYIIRGEPESTAASLLSALRQGGGSLHRVPSLCYADDGGIHHTDSAPPVDLASLPPPAYDLVQARYYDYELLAAPLAVLETSRGCPHRCAPCFKSMYGSRIRTKPLPRVEAEIEQVVRAGYRFVYFMDLEFSLDRRRAFDLCGLIRERGVRWCCQTRVDAVDPQLLHEMASAGCRLVHYGVESGDADLLHRMGKNIGLGQAEDAVRWTKEAGMAAAGFFLLGLPGEARASWLKTEAFARKLNPTYASFHLVTEYPGTRLAAARGASGPWWEAKAPDPHLLSRLRRIYLRYYLRPRYWREFLLRGPRRLAPLRLFLQFLSGLTHGRAATGPSSFNDGSVAPHL